MESTPEMVRMLAVTYAEQAIDKAERNTWTKPWRSRSAQTTLRPHEPLVLYALGTVHEARGEHAQAEENLPEAHPPRSEVAVRPTGRTAVKHASN